MAVSSLSWSEFLPELLDAVLNYARDFQTCATVCSTWRDSSSAVYSRKFDSFLFVSHVSSDEDILFSDQFGVLSPGYLGFSENRQTWVCGGTQGFLLTVTASYPFEVHLRKPFTNSVTSLPPLISFVDVQQLLQSQATFPDSEALKHFVKKAVSSTSSLEADWAVLVIYNNDRKLAFCRRGDKQWTDLESVTSSVDDIVFCNGLFFAIDRFGEIYHCELSPNNPNPKAIPFCSASPFRYDTCRKYFAELGYNGLWVVLKKLELNDDCDFTTYFEIYEFSSKTNEWTKVISLRGRALFVSTQGRCIAISAGENGYRGYIEDNSVYFIDGDDPSRGGSGPQNLSVFEWESKKNIEIYKPRSWNCQMFWLTPTDFLQG
ncbi:PREDICTED: putative F-box protein At5g55150 [Camelina sativa]|uniref:F-box protein At5g55150 n=1 Tax=Camelina sativa TaxID=90675 RepID=A0ABM0V0Y2_CAMSA|nr:PREDICTED: putative F-box protein At5g55150 [Camelina sativa]